MQNFFFFFISKEMVNIQNIISGLEYFDFNSSLLYSDILIKTERRKNNTQNLTSNTIPV